jgi:[ribosomal protein S5]-alanine N-acetyltransferase
VRATRLIALDDAEVLGELVRVNREFLAPTDVGHDEDYFTADGQRARIADALTRHAQGTMQPRVILTEAGLVAGRINLNDIVRGAFWSCHLGYWLNEADNGRGLATAAVREIIEVAFGELGLHRIEAGTLPDNVRSQRVLERNGFTRIGLAPDYLRIAGSWQDHVLFQLVRPDSDRGPAAAPHS